MNLDSRGSRVWLLLTIGIVGISTSTLWIRMSESDGVALAFRRLALAFPVLWAWAHFRRERAPLASAHWPVIAAGFFLALHFGTWMASLAHLSVATSVVLVYIHPVIVYGIEVARGQARADRLRLTGVVVTLIGAVILALAATGERIGLEGANPLLGVLLAITGSLAFVGYIFAGRSACLKLPPTVYAARAYAVGALLLAAYLLLISGDLWPDTPREWGLAAMLALFPTLLGHTPLNAALPLLPPSVVSTAFLGEVAGAPLLVWLVIGEVPPEAFWIGGPLVVGGIVAVAMRGAGEITVPRK